MTSLYKYPTIPNILIKKKKTYQKKYPTIPTYIGNMSFFCGGKPFFFFFVKGANPYYVDLAFFTRHELTKCTNIKLQYT